MGNVCEKKPDDLSHSFASFYDLSWKDIDGNVVNFDAFKGKMVICVNVATN